MNWHILKKEDQLTFIDDLSNEQYCLIFKHSTRCSISTIAKSRLEKNWQLPEDKITPFYLDLISFRNISDKITTRYAVKHQSPQIIIIKDGIAIYDTSHLDIQIKNIEANISEDT